MAPIAIDPPAAPASTARSLVRSIMKTGAYSSQAGRRAPQKRGGRHLFAPPPRQDGPWYLLQVGVDRQVGREPGDEGRTAPLRAQAARIDRRDVGRAGGGVIAGEGVAITLVQVGVDVAQIDREHLPGPAEARIP